MEPFELLEMWKVTLTTYRPVTVEWWEAARIVAYLRLVYEFMASNDLDNAQALTKSLMLLLTPPYDLDDPEEFEHFQQVVEQELNDLRERMK